MSSLTRREESDDAAPYSCGMIPLLLLLVPSPLHSLSLQYYVTIQQSNVIASRIPSHPRSRRRRRQPLQHSASTNDDDSYRSTIDESSSSSEIYEGTKQSPGDTDPRHATGIRSSLHPTTINCIAEALLLRSSSSSSSSRNNNRDDKNRRIAIDIRDPNNEPLQVAITAGNIAATAILRRSNVTKVDGTNDESSIFTTDESQLISGRVVGVVMRTRELEMELVQRVSLVDWVQKYNEEASFGILVEECQRVGGGSSLSSSMNNNEMLLAARIRTDPLFRMNRAECLLALFLTNVERPRMKAMNMILPGGGSDVDFIDDDRLMVILPEYSKPVTY